MLRLAMARTRCCVAVLIAIGSVSHASAELPWFVSPDGYGPATLRMTPTEVGQALHVELRDTGASNPPCVEMRPTKGYPDLTLIFQNRQLAGAVVSGKSAVTSSRGIGIGATKLAVQMAYDDWSLEVAHGEGDSPQAERWTYWYAGQWRGIQFRLGEDGRVRAIAGGSRSIRNGEGCL